MNKHDYIHLFKDMAHLLKQAAVHSNSAVTDDYINKAKGILWEIADDIGVDLLKD